MIPDFQSCMLPLLKLAGDKKEYHIRKATEELSKEFALTEEEKKELLPSGTQEIMHNRVGWAKSYMQKAVLLQMTRRGYFRITPRGLDVLKSSPKKISIKYLEQFEEFQKFLDAARKSQTKQEKKQEDTFNESTPEEIIEIGYHKLRNDLISELLEFMLDDAKCSPSFFENLVVDLLVEMGYGGSKKDAGQAIGKSGDEGIDGIIKEDKLGLDVVYIQAKKWKGQIGRPEIQKFAGALQGQRARKGIFIATSSFSSQARDYVAKIESKIILIDGVMLANLMIEHNVGVQMAQSYQLKKIDYDYFGAD
jgi:restriction system protein